MNLVKVSRIQMIFWFAMSGLTLIMVLVLCFVQGWDEWALYLWTPVICAIMALLRMWQWKKLQRSSADRDAREGKK